MKMNSFKTSASDFIGLIVRQRLYLDENGFSKSPSASEDARFIDLHIRAYPNRNDSSMAAFWMRNHDRIFNIIPGVRSGSSKSLTKRFDELHQEAERIFKNHLITPKIKLHANTNY